VIQILSAIDRGDPQAVEQLSLLVCDELRRLAAHLLARENAAQARQRPRRR
jgi:ECF sigma factor